MAIAVMGIVGAAFIVVRNQGTVTSWVFGAVFLAVCTAVAALRWRRATRGGADWLD